MGGGLIYPRNGMPVLFRSSGAAKKLTRSATTCALVLPPDAKPHRVRWRRKSLKCEPGNSATYTPNEVVGVLPLHKEKVRKSSENRQRLSKPRRPEECRPFVPQTRHSMLGSVSPSLRDNVAEDNIEKNWNEAKAEPQRTAW